MRRKEPVCNHKKEQIEEGHVIADIDPRNWFKVVSNDPNNIKESFWLVCLSQAKSTETAIIGRLCKS